MKSGRIMPRSELLTILADVPPEQFVPLMPLPDSPCEVLQVVFHIGSMLRSGNVGISHVQIQNLLAHDKLLSHSAALTWDRLLQRAIDTGQPEYTEP